MLPATTIPPLATDRYVRILRWTFCRDGENVVCELGLTGDNSAYELRVQPPWNPTGATTERFDDAFSAFQRHGTIERILISEGWSLDAFDSDWVERTGERVVHSDSSQLTVHSHD